MEILFIPLALAPIVMLMAIPILICAAVWKLVCRRRSSSLSSEELEQLQRMWHLLDRMEQRVANLEAILEDREAEVPHELKR